MSEPALSGLELLATAVVLLDAGLRVVHANPSAENLLGASSRALAGQAFCTLFIDAQPLRAKLREAVERGWGFWDQEVLLTRQGGGLLALNCLVTPVDGPSETRLVVELRSIDQRQRIERGERALTYAFANRELIRNLAHEIKNPLGGLRGSAQLLERELERPELREYTQVIIKEADRLQVLMDRLLTPHRAPHPGPVNVHEVCDRVRSLILAEFPDGVRIVRDFDASLPDLHGDREQLIQVVLNVVRNGAQAITGARKRGDESPGTITLRTRVARFVTVGRRMHRLALELQVIDDGPGIPPELRERVFYPLVSGREGGTGLGLTLAQAYVQQHGGSIECESAPGRTVFRILFPLDATRAAA
jgi:two-component system nitrogen regulation sensor histidine kinase GlnL